MDNDGIGTWIHRRRVKSAGRVAIAFGAETITYEQLAQRIDRTADALRGWGVAKGDRVAFLGENSPAFLDVLFATGLLGAIFVPLNTRLAPPEIGYALIDAEPQLLVHTPELTEAARLGCADNPIRRVVTNGVDDGAETWDDAPQAAEGTAATVSATDPAMILYTSGTTGRPKGALLTHGNITWNCLNVLVDYDVTSSTTALMISPMFHVASLTMGVLPTLLKGGTVVLESGFDPGRTLALIEQHDITSMSGVPTTYQMLCEHPAWATTDLGSLRTLTCGGSAVPIRVIDAYEKRGLAFTGGYGMTETAPGATSLQPQHSRSKAGSAGLPMFFTEVRVQHPDGSTCPPNVDGEIEVRGANVIPGYWHRPEATAEAFSAGGWFRSGDLGHFDEDGFLTISGRAKEMIISGGENIYPAEIEQIVMELDAVESVAVVGMPDARWGEVPRAYVQLHPGHKLEADELRAHLDGRVARFKIPRSMVVVADMPRTPSGKIRKGELTANPA